MTEAPGRQPRQPLVPPGGDDLHVRDMTATFAADLTLRDVQSRLAEQGQWLPVDGDPDASLATLVETNSTGPLRLGYGAWRDLLLGVQFTNGRGELVTAGGRTVKNVAGYDLTKFMVGQHGVFGRLVTVTTRTYRRPAAALLATVAVDQAAVAALLPTPCRPQWSLLTSESILLGYLGDEDTIRYYESELLKYQPAPLLWLKLARQDVDADAALRSRLWSNAWLGGDGERYGGPMFRASVPPVRLFEIDRDWLYEDQWAADPAFGIVVGRCRADADDALRSWVSGTGGQVTFYDGHGAPRRMRVDATTAGVLGRLKAAFDPDNRLAPLPVE